jgi:hypothetical protein
MLTNAEWMRLEPLIEACRPSEPPRDFRRLIGLGQAAKACTSASA